MYKGICSNFGITVEEENAFSYALEKCFNECQRAFSEFLVEIECNLLMILSDKKKLQWFKNELVEWFYSGNWVKED